MSTSLTDAIYQFVFSAATIGLIVGFLVWLWRRYYRWRTFITQGKGKVLVREPFSLGRRFLGRRDELKALENAIADNVPAVIVGTAGVGKTTLGLALADRLRHWECRLVWLGCTSDTNLEAILDALSLHLKNRYREDALREAFEKTQAHDAAQWIDVLTDCLHGSRYILFLDDLYLVEDRIVTSELLPRLFACANVIIMTREVTPDIRTSLQTVGKSSIVQLTGLSEDDALVLLQDLGLADEPKDLLLQLVQRVDGHPKALEIGAGLVKDKTRGLALEQLVSQSILGKDPQKPLMKMIRISDKRLSGRERSLMVACATFYESFSLEETFAIYGNSQLVAMLQDLVRRSLVEKDQGKTYSLHPLVREFYQVLGNRMLWTRWKAFIVPWPFYLVVQFGPMWRWRLARVFHIRAAQYYQESRKDSAENELLVSQHLRRAGWWYGAAEAEGIVLKIQCHPIAIVDHLWALLVLIGFVWIFVYFILPVLAGIGWAWIVWLDMRKLSIATVATIVGASGWFLYERRMLQYSWLLVTRKGSLLISQHAWFLPRLQKPMRVYLGPGRWRWWYDKPFIDGGTLTVRRSWLGGKTNLGYIMGHNQLSYQGGPVLRFGPIVEPEKRLAEIYQALDVDQPAYETAEQ